MIWQSLVHKVAKFYLPGTVNKGLPIAAPLFGQVLTVTPCENARGGIPNAKLRIKGRTGRELTIDVVEHYASFFETWEEALKS